MLFAPRESGVSHMQVAGPPERVKLVPASGDADDEDSVSAIQHELRPGIVESGASFHVISQRDLKCLKCRRQQKVRGDPHSHRQRQCACVGRGLGIRGAIVLLALMPRHAPMSEIAAPWYPVRP